MTTEKALSQCLVANEVDWTPTGALIAALLLVVIAAAFALAWVMDR